ncbi:MAG: ABC transporter permease [Bacteroidia bacterium]
MNFEHFIAKKIVFSKQGEGSISQPIVRIAVGGVALGLAVMILSIAIVTGFKREISEKVIGFGSHIQISNFDANFSYETTPIAKSDELKTNLHEIQGVKHIQVFATKAGIVKTEDDIMGVVLKGIGDDFDWSFFSDKMFAGSIFTVDDSARTNNVVISKNIATSLNLKVGDKLTTYFIEQPPRVRNFDIAGIYETGLEEFDKLYVLVDIGHIQRLNDWEDNQVGGYEVKVNDFSKLTEIGEEVYEKTGFDLNARTIKEIYPQIFDWLELQNINVIIIISLIVLVAGINMISALIILILERTNMIGILKAVGAEDVSIRKIFIITATYLLGAGLIIGNAVGLILCFLQDQFELVKLDQQSYYVSVVPISFTFLDFTLLNIGTLIVCVLMMILPSVIITRISPVKAIRFA